MTVILRREHYFLVPQSRLNWFAVRYRHFSVHTTQAALSSGIFILKAFQHPNVMTFTGGFLHRMLIMHYVMSNGSILKCVRHHCSPVKLR